MAKFVGIISCNYFHVKICLILLVIPYLMTTQSFFADNLNYKTVSKTTCRTPSINPCQVCAH